MPPPSLRPSQIQPLGDQALLLRWESEQQAQQAYFTLDSQQLPWVRDLVLAYSTLGIYLETSLITLQKACAALQEIPCVTEEKMLAPRTHIIPVCYELGDDFLFVAEQKSLTPAELIYHHTRVTYRIYAMGFCPGFPYLGYLPSELCGLPRLRTPRVRVEAGSVGLTGRQTGIYPLERPGGWPLIGKTPLELVNVEEGYFPLRVGDQVKFVAIDRAEYHKRYRKREL